MKKLLSILLCVLLLTACSNTPDPITATTTDPTTQESTAAPTTQESTTAPTEEATTAPAELFTFTRENFPRMDGSTALVPLGEAIASVLLGEPREAVSDLISFNRTTQSYRNLMWDYCDILIAAEPAASVVEEMEAEHFQYEMTPIATDALIFVVNSSNPVDNLTTEQLQKIYSGEITNWKEVGGNDEAILAFQRNADAGSQTLMKKLVMGDIPFAEAPKDVIVGSMGELMESVKNYDNSANAIGYSVYYYANDMRMAEGLKIISIDGVEPTPETIAAGQYPHLNPYYTVIPEDAAPGSPNRVLYEWLLSEEGQYLLSLEGYVPVK
ncbi:MAG: substrate-binding domain-containing protein [Oscillospiraceae bacterium]|nr:substrate-binding domain-containing protein [Oscillospiraceae bacterium]